MSKAIKKLLIANRGEIAVRIARTAAELDITTVAIYSNDDANSLHVRRADEAIALEGIGARAYLNIDAIIATAKQHQADAIHPGYGFLAENAEFAQQVEAAGIIFIGPSPASLKLLGDKLLAKQRAIELNVPVLAGTQGATTVEQA